MKVALCKLKNHWNKENNNNGEKKLVYQKHPNNRYSRKKNNLKLNKQPIITFLVILLYIVNVDLNN